MAEEEQLKHGAVLDATAAEILTRRGFDVGVKSFGQVLSQGAECPGVEHYGEEKDDVPTSGGRWMQMTLKEGTKLQSWLPLSKDKAMPSCYTYENAAGQKFLVYAFCGQTSYEHGVGRGVFRSWCRAAQLRRLLPWLSGRRLDAVCDGAPDLYILTKSSESELTVGLWNFNVDSVKKPVVHLGEEWSELVSQWGAASLQGDQVVLGELAPFACACFTLKK